jgi:RNA polymerase sigma factor (sigma-70 family)
MSKIRLQKRKISNEEYETALADINNIKIIQKVTSRYTNLIPQDDLKSCALHALWRALTYHDPNRGQKFTTSLWRFTEWECRRELVRQKKKKNTISFSSIEFDVAADGVNEDVVHIRECLTLLPKTDREVLTQYYIDKYTMEEIGKRNGYSKEAARQKINKAVAKLCEIYSE